MNRAALSRSRVYAPRTVGLSRPSGNRSGNPDVVTNLYGLDWNGTGPGRRMVRFGTPPTAFPMTYLFKVYQRQQVTSPSTARYYTTFFHGNDGAFYWGTETQRTRSYYGAHPYPVPWNDGDGKWEISVNADDAVARDDTSEPYMVPDAWYSQAFTAADNGDSTYTTRFYINLPDVTTEWRITYTSDWTGTGYITPPTPIICIGQAPDNGSGQSWGGYPRWEEQNATIRGIQIYSSVLTEAQIVALSGKETDTEVTDYCTAQSITSLWYLNMNPRPSDVTDKSGGGHNPTIVTTNGAAIAEWSGTL